MGRSREMEMGRKCFRTIVCKVQIVAVQGALKTVVADRQLDVGNYNHALTHDRDWNRDYKSQRQRSDCVAQAPVSMDLFRSVSS